MHAGRHVVVPARLLILTSRGTARPSDLHPLLIGNNSEHPAGYGDFLSSFCSSGWTGWVSYQIPTLEAGQMPALQGRVSISSFSVAHVLTIVFTFVTAKVVCAKWFVIATKASSSLGGAAGVLLHCISASGWTPTHLDRGSGLQGHLYDWC